MCFHFCFIVAFIFCEIVAFMFTNYLLLFVKSLLFVAYCLSLCFQFQTCELFVFCEFSFRVKSKRIIVFSKFASESKRLLEIALPNVWYSQKMTNLSRSCLGLDYQCLPVQVFWLASVCFLLQHGCVVLSYDRSPMFRWSPVRPGLVRGNDEKTTGAPVSFPFFYRFLLDFWWYPLIRD